MTLVLKTNPERTNKIIEILMDWYPKRTQLFENAELPEENRPHGMQSGSYEHIMFLTLTVSIDCTRSASHLWDAARKTWSDENTRWAFYPEEISKKTLEELIVVLGKYKLSKKTRKDAEIWRKVAISFLSLFEGDPKNLFKKFDYDSLQIFNAMRSQYGKSFPYLAGATGTSKILSLWIRMLHDHAQVDFKNLHEVPIPIDIHTARATIMTGCLSGNFIGSFNELSDEAKKAWVEACKTTDFYPLQLDEALWNLSRFGCTNHKNGNPCPVKSQCKLEKYCTANNPLSEIKINQNEPTIINSKLPEEK